MAAASESLWNPNRPVPRTRTGGRWLLPFLLCMFAVMAIVAVVAASVMGQSTVAMAIALVSAAFFAGMLC